MKHILQLTFFIIIFNSCTTYKIVEIKSDGINTTEKSYIYENDSVKITYKFWELNGIMSFDIYNKTNTPLYFDWKKSACIINDKMLSYWQDEVNTEGSSSSFAYSAVNGTANSKTKMKSKSIRQERIGIIPPHSLINNTKYYLTNNSILLNFNLNYTNTSTPLRIRNYLAISTNEDFTKNVSYIDNSFYVNKIYKIKSGKFNESVSNCSFYTKIR